MGPGAILATVMPAAMWFAGAMNTSQTANQTMQGKTVLITGATGGIGLESARALGQMGANLLLTARNPSRSEAALQSLRQSGLQNIEFFYGNLESLADVRRIASEIAAKHPKLDVLLNNAGTINQKRRVTVDGLEATFALNHLSYFLMTNLLLENLKQSSGARVVNVSSNAHNAARLNFDDLQSEKGYSAWISYGNSKLQNILFTTELSQRLQGTGVTANSLHPGVVNTNFGREGGGDISSFLFNLARPFFLTPAQGAATSIYLASSPEVSGVTGQYFDNKKVKTPSRAAQDRLSASRLWQISETLCKL
jgi:retinol dehydrogenase 12